MTIIEEEAVSHASSKAQGRQCARSGRGRGNVKSIRGWDRLGDAQSPEKRNAMSPALNREMIGVLMPGTR
jgi:hypothetical protein